MSQDYGPNDHRKAFELYRECRNLRHVSESLGINYSTIHRWQSAGFACTCPWHNWKVRLEEVDAGENAKLSLNPLQALDPIQVDQAVRGEEVSKRESLLTRSDIERLSQLEFLWSKFYYEITGIVLDVSTLIEASDSQTPLTDKMQEGYLRRGLTSKNAESATRTLLAIGKEIEEIKERLGLSSAARSGDVSKEEGNSAPQEMSLEDLRSAKKLLENTPSDKLKAMADILKSEEIAKRGLHVDG